VALVAWPQKWRSRLTSPDVWVVLAADAHQKRVESSENDFVVSSQTVGGRAHHVQCEISIFARRDDIPRRMPSDSLTAMDREGTTRRRQPLEYTVRDHVVVSRWWTVERSMKERPSTTARAA